MKKNDSTAPLSLPVFRQISAIAARQDVPAFVVGGYVRDFYLGRPSTDIDVVVVGSGIGLAEELGRELRTKVSVYKTFGTAALRTRGVEVEFVGARKESYVRDSRKPQVEAGTLEDDQRRRDFTINAMAWSLAEEDFGRLVDPFDGMRDLHEGIIRTPCDPDVTFSDDPLRMMRAVRFASQLNFRLFPETFEAIVRNRERIGIVSRERIAVELNKIVLSPVPSVGFDLLERTGLLELIFPEMQRLKGIERRGQHAHKDNFYHTLKVLDNVAAVSDDLWLRWAAILHDIGKPLTKAYDPQVGWTFHSHEVVGSKMVPAIFRALKLPMNEHMKFVRKMVFLHLRPIILSEDMVTDSAVRRLLFEAGDDVEKLMTLCEADITSGIDAKVKRYLQNFELVRRKMKDLEERDRIRNFQPPITGEIIMETYGVPPSRVIGEIKEIIKEAILEGEIPNDYEAAYALMERLSEELPPQMFVHYGNFIGKTLKIAAELQFDEVVMGIMIGKAVKLAEGALDTHSKKVVMNKAFLKELAAKAGCKPESVQKIDSLTLARELWELFSKTEQQSFFPLLLQKCREHCTPLLPNGKLSVLLISESGKITFQA